MSADDRVDRATRLEIAETAVRRVVEDQYLDHDPAHEDFYAWGATLSEITYRLQHVAVVLARQVDRYGDQRVLRDDVGMDPTERQDRIASEARDLAVQLAAANRTAQRLYSELSHMAVEPEPPEDPEGAEETVVARDADRGTGPGTAGTR